MSWGLICGSSTKASKRYVLRLLLVTFGYLLATFGTTTFVRHANPHGFEVYLLAMLPTIPVLCMLGVVGLYLCEEKDEFQRMLLVRATLIAIAGVLGMETYVDFLRSYKAIGALPPFADFLTFWLLSGLVQAVQQMMNRVKSDD